MADRIRYVCAGCGASVNPANEQPFRCPNANGDDVDAALPDDEDGLPYPAADLRITVGTQPVVNVIALRQRWLS